MKLNEIIELNGKEYTTELNRESIVRIEQYTNLSEASKKMNKTAYTDKSNKEIEDDENPFSEEISEEKIDKVNEEKAETLRKIITRAFWIWLYPAEKLSYNEVNDLLEPYFEDEEKAEYIAEKYKTLSEKSVEIRENYIKEQKNLKAQAK